MTWIENATVVTAEDIAAEQAKNQELEERVASIESAIKESGLFDFTLVQAENWIDQQYAGATTMIEGFAATKRILKKMIAVIIRGRI